MGYNTKQGELILNLLKNSGGRHLTAEDISHILGERGCPVGKATVYRHLEKMLREGSVRKFVLHDGESACYQYVGDHHDCHLHPHMVCECCGRLFHLDCSQLEALSEHIREHHGFLLDYKNTILYGVCAACLAKEETP